MKVNIGPYSDQGEPDVCFEAAEAEGTFGSLVSAGIVYHYEDDLFALTEDWAALRSFHA